jgi:hypothetical protein
MLRHSSFAPLIKVDLLTCIFPCYSPRTEAHGQQTGWYRFNLTNCSSRILKKNVGFIKSHRSLDDTPATEPCLGCGPLTSRVGCRGYCRIIAQHQTSHILLSAEYECGLFARKRVRMSIQVLPHLTNIVNHEFTSHRYIFL